MIDYNKFFELSADLFLITDLNQQFSMMFFS